ncbi:hypothetical protein BRCON_1826 [Candidatus Sumerlaea chitinivorans]|uniref:Uncharacterized protein n=1 Tax=Sumerlaea chitinivorans TaxID=2250252 RepID=A0A2Z4Y837_SUMC1|nr:hypothetical protein BRCON_1826 [Candidatus Sumerlaea chitinivorans]
MRLAISQKFQPLNQGSFKSRCLICERQQNRPATLRGQIYQRMQFH